MLFIKASKSFSNILHTDTLYFPKLVLKISAFQEVYWLKGRL